MNKVASEITYLLRISLPKVRRDLKSKVITRVRNEVEHKINQKFNWFGFPQNIWNELREKRRP